MSKFFDISNARIILPQDSFAKSAGHDSWADALAAMKAGKVIVGTMLVAGKSTFGLRILTDVIVNEGLITVPVNHDTSVAIGYREYFSPDLLAEYDRLHAELEQRIQQYLAR